MYTNINMQAHAYINRFFCKKSGNKMTYTSTKRNSLPKKNSQEAENNYKINALNKLEHT